MKVKKWPLKMHLQMFSEEENPTGDNKSTQQATDNQGAMFDYDKLASIISGKQSVTEDTILKNYFKQQGMSKEEMDQAIQTFKDKKAQATPNIAQLQAQAQAAQEKAQKAELESKATLAAIKMGVDIKVLPYVMKMADLSSLTVESKEEDFTQVFNKVLEDVPALKASNEANTGGFQPIGATGKNQETNPQADALSRAFGNK